MTENGKPETIQSDDALPRGQITSIETKGDYLRIKVAAYISGAALIVGVGFLVVAIATHDDELQTWASGLISLVVGAAIGFAFSGSSGGNS